MAKHLLDLTGKQYGRLTVVENAGKDSTGRAIWKCVCICGNFCVVQNASLKNGGIKSCGCLRKEQRAERAKSLAAQKRLGGDEASFRKLLRTYQSNAVRRGIKFELSVSEFRKLTQDTCNYCGKGPEQIARNYAQSETFYTYNGIDRVDNSDGYTYNNCVTCCKICNRLKLSLDEDAFYESIQNIYEFLVIEGIIECRIKPKDLGTGWEWKD